MTPPVRPQPVAISPRLAQAFARYLQQQPDATATHGTQQAGLVQATVDALRQLSPEGAQQGQAMMALAHQRGYATPDWSAYNPLSYIGITGPAEDQMYPASRQQPPLPFAQGRR
jgi:hypothetical protein